MGDPQQGTRSWRIPCCLAALGKYDGDRDGSGCGVVEHTAGGLLVASNERVFRQDLAAVGVAGLGERDRRHVAAVEIGDRPFVHFAAGQTSTISGAPGWTTYTHNGGADFGAGACNGDLGIAVSASGAVVTGYFCANGQINANAAFDAGLAAAIAGM